MLQAAKLRQKWQTKAFNVKKSEIMSGKSAQAIVAVVLFGHFQVENGGDGFHHVADRILVGEAGGKPTLGIFGRKGNLDTENILYCLDNDRQRHIIEVEHMVFRKFLRLHFWVRHHR